MNKRVSAYSERDRECPVVYFVVPCYNEEEALPEVKPSFLAMLSSMQDSGLAAPESKICFVDDGSSDATWGIICAYSEELACVEGIKLSRNRGHQNALLAGLMEVRGLCDVAISMDCDGQDDFCAAAAMIEEYLQGCEIVYGVRKKRDTDSFFKRFTAESFYRIMERMGVDVVFNHADYRLMSKRALDELAEYHEVNLYLRGMVPLIGFKTATVEYERAERVKGDSHYPLGKMLSLAADGITSMTAQPLHWIAMAGVIFACVGGVGIVWALVQLLLGRTVAGWTSVIVVMLLLGGAAYFAWHPGGIRWKAVP